MWACSLGKCCEQCPMVAVGLWCMGRHKLWTMNTIAFYQWQFECIEILWQDHEAHCRDIHPPWYHLMFQQDNTQTHVARILKAENVPVLPWPAYSPDMSPIEHVWDALDLRVLSIDRNIARHCRGVGQHCTGHNQQPNQLYKKEMCCVAWGKWWSHQKTRYWLILWYTPLTF